MPDLTLPEAPGKPKGDKKSLAVALITAFVFLLAAVGVAVWLFMQKNSQTVITQLDPNSTVNVKSVAWIEPAELPKNYVRYDQTTGEETVLYYANAGDGCSVAARVLKNYTGDNPMQNAAKANDSSGIATDSVTEYPSGTTISDPDGQRQYDFVAAEFSQKVTVPTLSYDYRSGTVYYKEFGNDLAVLSFSCPAQNPYDQAVAAERSNFIQQFKIATER